VRNNLHKKGGAKMFLISPFGRIGRGQWWLGVLASIMVLAVGLVFTSIVLGTNSPGSSRSSAQLSGIVISLFLSFYINVCTIITRYHDRGKSGWWYFFGFIPAIGWIWQIIECGCLPGDDNDNEYGDGNGDGFDISHEIAAMANQGQPKPAFIAKSSFSPPVGNTQPSQGFGQAPKPMFGSR
jgi:uncharacterized membrane protein YhaH (DUF805 family)